MVVSSSSTLTRFTAKCAASSTTDHGEASAVSRGVDLEAAVRRIQLLPGSAPRWLLEAPFEIRRAKVKRHPYLVIYAVLEDQLVVLAIAHTNRNPGYWRDRMEK